MSAITIEQIDLLMSRANVSYAEAKEALEKTDGDVVEALLFLEKSAKIKPEPCSEPSSGQKVNSFINKLNATHFILKKKEHIFVNVPLSVALILTVCTLHVSVITFLVAFIFGVRLEIKGDNEIAEKINSTMEHITK